MLSRKRECFANMTFASSDRRTNSWPLLRPSDVTTRCQLCLQVIIDSTLLRGDPLRTRLQLGSCDIDSYVLAYWFTSRWAPFTVPNHPGAGASRSTELACRSVASSTETPRAFDSLSFAFGNGCGTVDEPGISRPGLNATLSLAPEALSDCNCNRTVWSQSAATKASSFGCLLSFDEWWDRTSSEWDPC